MRISSWNQISIGTLREQRRHRHEIDVEIRPLERYDRLIPA